MGMLSRSNSVAIRPGPLTFSPGKTLGALRARLTMQQLDGISHLIPATTRRQAMDWSLALISQGIESVVEKTEDGWGLHIKVCDRASALETIRLYRRENRGITWNRRLAWPAFSFHFGAVWWCMALVVVAWLAWSPGSSLQASGRMDSLAVSNGAWWRLFTATVLHVDVAHLATNLAIGFCLVGLAMGRFGPGIALLATWLAGAGGNLVGFIIHSTPYQGVGASGMIMGALGLLGTQLFGVRRFNSMRTRYAVTAVFATLMLFVLIGLDPSSDVLAHVGGLLSGLVTGTLLAAIPYSNLHSRRLNLAAGLTLGALFALTWAMALR